MICCHTHRHSIFCILPPHILRQIAVHGSADERRAAVDTLATDQTFRAMRTEIGAAGSTSRTAPATLAEEGEPHRTIS
ncbi:hypothetical protein SE17_34375, partial [Kouleothrix aurantiaca]